MVSQLNSNKIKILKILITIVDIIFVIISLINIYEFSGADSGSFRNLAIFYLM